MPYAVTQGGVGNQQIALYGLPDSTSRHQPGLLVSAVDNYWGMGEFMYVKAGGAVRMGGVVIITPTLTSGAYIPVVTEAASTANQGRAVGIAMTSTASGNFGWLCVFGLVPVNSNASVAATALLGIAAAHAIVMAYQEKALHQLVATNRENRMLRERLLDQLPSLLSMESILFRQLWAGFMLLSLTLVTGFLFSEAWRGTSGNFDHKTLFAVISWCSFAVLLGGRVVFGWRGKVALRWCLGSYAVLVLAYFGTQFVLEFILKRAA